MDTDSTGIIQIGIILSLFADDMILYLKDPKDSTKKKKKC
jgi:hypothetical protein